MEAAEKSGIDERAGGIEPGDKGVSIAAITLEGLYEGKIRTRSIADNGGVALVIDCNSGALVEIVSAQIG